jgi:hypothetical protein
MTIGIARGPSLLAANDRVVVCLIYNLPNLSIIINKTVLVEQHCCIFNPKTSDLCVRSAPNVRFYGLGNNS